MMRGESRYQPGDRIGGRYQVHQVKMGGMGEVYLCLDWEEMLPYALKTFQQRFLTDAPRLRQAFEKEVAVWVALEKHPHIVRCFWMKVLDNQPFMVLEWVAGEEERGADLGDWLRRGPLDLRTALDFAIDICRGLVYAQEKQPGIVHRDLKPKNILVAQGPLAKITDFGLAQIVARAGLEVDGATTDEASSRHTLFGEGGVVGTPLYMAPEQWRNERLDERTDIYALGCILYEMVSGRPPFISPPVASQQQQRRALRQQHETKPVSLAAVDAPAAILDLLRICLAKEREARPGNLRQLLLQLEQEYRQQFGAPPRAMPPAGRFTANDYFDRGYTYDMLQQYEAALADYGRVIQLDRTFAKAYANRSIVYYELQQYAAALADCDQAIQIDPNDVKAYSNRGNTYAALQQYEAALADYGRAIQLDPNHTDTYHNRGHAYAALQQYEAALSDFGRAIQIDPNYAYAYYGRGRTYIELQQYEAALSDFSRAIQIDPNYAYAYYGRGRTYIVLQQYEAALADYGRAIQIGPHYVEAYYNRGVTYKELQQYEAALADFSRAIQIDPNCAPAYYGRGRTYKELQQYEAALADFSRAIQIDPNNAEVYGSRGLTYAELQQYEAALADFGRAIQLNPNDAQAYCNWGVLLSKTGQLHEALPYFEKAAQLGLPKGAQNLAQARRMLDKEAAPHAEPTHEASQLYRIVEAASFLVSGNNHYASQQYKAALAEYDRAIQLNPNYADAYHNRGNTYKALQQYEAALVDFGQAIHLNPNDAQTYYGRGNTFEALQQYEAALADYGRAIQLNPNDAQAYCNWGVLLFKTGKLHEALPYFEKAAQLGLREGAQNLAQARRMLEKEAAPSVDPTQLAFVAFQEADSLAAMRQAVAAHPILKEARFITTIEQVIAGQVPPAQRPYFEQRLAWLRQIVNEQQSGWGRFFKKR